MTFRLKTIIGIALIETIFLSLIVWSSLSYLRNSSLEDISYQAESISSLFVTAIKDAVISRDLDSLSGSIENILDDKGVLYVRVYHGSDLIMEGGSSMFLSSPFIADDGHGLPVDGVYDTSRLILESGYNLGRIELGFDTGPINSRLAKANSEITTIAVLELIFCGVFSWALGVYLTKHLTLLRDGSKELESGNLGYQIPVTSQDELGDLTLAFNDMSTKVLSLLKVSEVQRLKIRERESLFNEILQGMPFGILLVNSSRKEVVFLNNVLYDFLGVNRSLSKGFVGMECSQVIVLMGQRFRNCELLESFFDKAIEGEVHLTSQELEITNNKFVEINFLPLRFSDDVVYYLFSFLDVTGRRAVEKEIRKRSSEFISIAAHELRTPMANIYGYSELLLNSRYSETIQLELIDIIYKQSERLVFILNDLLDLARIESKGIKDLTLEFVSLESVINDCVKLFESDSNRSFNLTLGNINRVRCDKNKIIQVVNNVISNALKYSPSGSVVNVSLDQCGCLGINGPSIIIEDKGVGMSEEEVGRIFERFYRVDASGKIPGTGLGMSIVKEIVDMHKGKIELQSRKGVGTKVIICLPYE